MCFMSAVRKYESPSIELTKQASLSSNEILPGLVIGSIGQCRKAQENGYVTICVRHIGCPLVDCVHSPVLDLSTWIASQAEMENFCDALGASWGAGKKTFVHCFHGIERAPLAVAYAIKRNVTPQIPFEDVYAFVRRMRPVALDRINWLEHIP